MRTYNNEGKTEGGKNNNNNNKTNNRNEISGRDSERVPCLLWKQRDRAINETSKKIGNDVDNFKHFFSEKKSSGDS